MAIGIDIGATTTRVVVAEKKGAQVEVIGYARLPTKEVIGPEAKPGRLAEALAAAGVRRGVAAISASGRDMILKISNYPVVPDWRLRLLIEYETNELSERAGGDILSGYRILNIPERGRSEITALLALAKEPYVEERIALLEGAGCKLDAAYPSPVAIGNAYAASASPMELGRTVMVVDIGEESTDVALVHSGKIIFARNANFGGSAFTRAVAETFGVKERTAVKMKEDEGTLEPQAGSDPKTVKLSRALEGPAGDLANLLRSSVKFSQAQLRATELKIEAIVISGGVARLPGLGALLTEQLRLPVEILDLSGAVGEDLGAEALAAFKDDGPAAATAFGLAATSLDGGRRLLALKLLPARIERRRRFLHHELFVLLAAGTALVAAFVWYATVANNRDVEETRAVRLRQDADALHALKTNLDATIAERIRLLEERASWASVVEPGIAIAEALAAVRKHTPADAYLTGLTLQPRLDHLRRPTVVIGGKIRESTRSVTAIYDDFAAAMRAMPGYVFTTAQVDHDRDGGGLTFIANLEFREAPTPPPVED